MTRNQLSLPLDDMSEAPPRGTARVLFAHLEVTTDDPQGVSRALGELLGRGRR